MYTYHWSSGNIYCFGDLYIYDVDCVSLSCIVQYKASTLKELGTHPVADFILLTLTMHIYVVSIFTKTHTRNLTYSLRDCFNILLKTRHILRKHIGLS